MQTFKRRLPRVLALVLAGGLAIGCSAESKKARLLARADGFFNSGDYEKAKIEYLNVLRSDPQNAAAIKRLGTIWYEQGAPLRAAPFLMKTRELLPDDLNSRAKLALVLMSVGEFDEARKEALAILDHSPTDGQAMTILVESSRSRQDLDEAEKRLRETGATDKAGFHIASAATALRKQDLSSATSEAKQALSLDPGSADAHIALAKLLWLSGDLAGADREFKAASELAPPRSPARLAYADFKTRTGAVDEAVSYLQEITRQAPDSLQALRMLAQIAALQKRFDESLGHLENILFRDPANIEARLLQAQVWLAKGETKKALESLENLSAGLPKVPAIKLELARAYLQNNSVPQAISALDQAIAIYPDYTEAILLLAQVNLKNGNAQAVIPSMLNLLKQHPGLVQAQMILSEAYIAQGRTDDAISLLREQIKASPQDAAAHLRLGLILRRAAKFDEARKAFEETRQLAPQNTRALAQLVDLDIQDKAFGAATERIKAELQRNPQSSVLNFLEGKVHAAQGDWTHAEASLTQAIKLDPNFTSAYGSLILTYLARNELPKAIAQLQAVLAKNPKDVRALMLSANIYEKMGDFSAARNAYEKLLSVDPNFAPALNNLAYLYAERLNDLDKALELAKKARTLLPDDPAIADTLGWTLHQRADYQQALTLLQESAQNLPGNAEIQFHLGMANYSMGRMNEARAAFSRAVAELGDFPGREEARRRLASLENPASKEDGRSATELEGNLKEKPDDVVTTIRLAESYEKNGAFAQAATAYEEALKRNPKLLSATAKLAELYAGPLQNNQAALRYARIARELAPNDPKMEGLLGRIAYQAGNYSWAFSLLQESARRLPEDPKILHAFGWSAYSLGKVSEARMAMQRVITAAPAPSNESSDAKLLLEMTALTEDGANPIAAKSAVDEVLKASPDYVPALMARAAILRKSGDHDGSIAIYSEVLGRFPDFAPAQKYLALLYANDAEKREKAYDLAMKARKAYPDDPEVARLLGELSYQRKEFAYAVQLLKQSSEKSPLDAKSLYYLGMSHLKTNDREQSREALQEALAVGLSNSLASEAKSALAELEKEK